MNERLLLNLKNALPTLVLSMGLSTLASFTLAQQPLYLPDEIPLDVEEIYQALEPADNYAEITRSIIQELTRNHYQEIILNDQFSTDLLDSFIETLDGGRIYFTESDIAEFEGYRHQLDDLLKEGQLDAGYHIYNRYQERVIQRLVYSIKRIEEDQSDFDFSLDENIIIDRSEVPWADSLTELQDLWRKRIKSNMLTAKLSDEDLDEAREDLAERFRFQLSQVLKTNGLDVYQRYMDAMTMVFDPHTQYYAPRAAENFNMSMRLSLEGIGAVLTTEDEFTKVVSIVTGGPADMAGELQPLDRIAGVAQGDEDFVNVTGWRVGDVVDLIRGAKGSVVRLNVIPKAADNDLTRKVIQITRDTVKLEEQSAKKEIVEVDYEGGTYKIGVIDLPTFYIDFEALQRRDPNYRSSTRDVKRLLEELKAEGVDGVVVDLRRNGGGSLSEANALVGLFIRRGPTVQVRDAEGNNIVQGDSDPEMVYEGPLGVLVNRLSASASEIFAGAIQDYQRGVILGSQTFGKGTVQELIPMSEGQMKITRAKFYRISGESTQHKGVTPDVIFPDLYDSFDDLGESALSTALPWDTIDANYYRPYADLRPIMPTLVKSHEARIDEDPDFTFIRAQIQKAEENKDRNELSLNEASLLAEQDENDAWRLATENARLIAKGEEPFEDIDALDGKDEEDENDLALVESDAEDALSDDDELETEELALESDDDAELDEDDEDEADPYLIESGKILLDLLRLQGGTAVSLAAK